MANPAATELRPARLESVDLLRGLVMVIMALDHVRDFWSERLMRDPVDLSDTTVPIFLTRWITHYCAPTFIFLAGAGAFLSGTRGKSKLELSWFLLTRGLWLAFLEITVIRASWYFNFDVYHHGAGVFWAIGWSMVVLAGLVQLPLSAILVFGIGMIALHNRLLDGLVATDIHLPAWLFTGAEQYHMPEWLWIILHRPGDAPILRDVQLGIAPGPVLGPLPPGMPPPSHDLTFGTGYCLIPWMGVMAAGYGFGALLTLEAGKRKKELLGLGIALTLAFFLLRYANIYGDPRPWEKQPRGNWFTFCSFLNCTKYPPSLLYLLMTIGPGIVLLGLCEWTGPLFKRLTRPLVVFGRVPLFYYFLHIPLIHGGIALLDYCRYGWSPQVLDGPWAVRLHIEPELYGVATALAGPFQSGAAYATASYLQTDRTPIDYGVSLPVVYLLWIAVVFILYWPCAWFAGVKQRNKSVWLSYL
jgi:uncharacterized membrane protein